MTAPRTLRWSDLLRADAAALDGGAFVVTGHVAPIEDAPEGAALLVPDAACCPGCRPDPALTIELLGASGLPRGLARVALSGTLRRLPEDDDAGWRWQMRGAAARVLGGASAFPSRRAVLAAPLACAAVVPGCAEAQTADPARQAAARAVIAQAPPMDLHSHAGRVLLRRGVNQRPFEPVAAPMRAGGMRAIALCIVADTPTTETTQDRRIRAFRDPAPGELYEHSRVAFARLEALVRQDGVGVITDRAGLRAALAPGAAPAVIVSSEGADFLEGRIERVDEAFERHQLRLLQLTHYRVNELGDIQTAPAVHDGLTPFGAEVIRACNRLGIAVDIAHGPIGLVRRAAEVTTKPLILSHTSLANRPGPQSRQVTAEHARIVARTGGVVGIWPPVTIFPDLGAYARGLGRMAEAIGVDHVGIGSDMRGLLSPAAFDSYDQTPALAEALLGAGFSAADCAKVMGGNAARVMMANLPGA